MTNKEIAQQILDLIGGAGNVANATHCATRLRLNLRENQVSMAELERITGVIKAQMSNGQLQVVLGGKVTGVYSEFTALLGDNNGGNEAGVPEGRKRFSFNAVIETIAGIFSPTLPVLIGCGMMKSLVAILSSMNVMPADSGFFTVLNMIGDLIFYFLPFFLAISAAKKFKTNEFMAVALAGAYMYPTIMNGAAAAAQTGVSTISFLGLPVLLVNYKSTVIPIILSVWVMKYVYKFIDRIIPEAVKIIFVPMLTLLVMVPLELIALGPVGSYLGVYIASGVKLLYTAGGMAGAFLLGAFRPVLVMFGMHYAITPIMVQELAETGKTIIIPALFAGNMAQSGACFATALLLKDKKEKSGGFSAAFTAFLGITEPAMYGYNLKYKKPFFAALAAAGVAAAYMSVFNAYSTAAALPGILSISTYYADSFIHIIIGVVIAVVGAAALTLVMGIEGKGRIDK